MAVNNLVEQIFRPVGPDVLRTPNPNSKIDGGFPFKKGNLITFNYTFWKHDPYPLVVISPPPKNPTITFGIGHLWGVNIHLLTFFDIKQLLRSSKNPNFSYVNYVKGNNAIKRAYRSYKWSGIRQVKTLNYEFFLNIVGTIRNQDPADVEIVRKNVQEQIQQQINPKPYEINVSTLNNNDGIKTVPIVGTVPTVQNRSNQDKVE
jgi:hypothetical protein